MKILNLVILFVLILSSCSKKEAYKESNSKESNKSYDLIWYDDKLYIDIPRPSRVPSTDFDFDWHGVEIEDIVADVFEELRENKNFDYVDVIVRMNYIQTDKYGNESMAFNEKSVGVFSISEVKKYKDKSFFDKRYHIYTNIKDAALGRDVIMHVNEKTIKAKQIAKEAEENVTNETDSVKVEFVEPNDTLTIIPRSSRPAAKKHNK